MKMKCLTTALMMLFSLSACSSGKKGSDSSSVTSEDSGVSIVEKTLFNDEGITVTATGFTDGFNGPSMNLLVENNTGQDITIQTNYCIVNGFVIDPILSTNVTAGKKANDSMILLSDELSQCKIETITDISVSFNVLDSLSYETIVVTPKADITTSAYGSYEQIYDIKGDTLFDNGEIRILATDITDDDFGMNLGIYIENNSDRNVTVQTRDVSVNGFMTDTVFSPSVYSHSRKMDQIVFVRESLEQNGIESFDEIDLKIMIFDSDSYEIICDSDAITLNR